MRTHLLAATALTSTIGFLIPGASYAAPVYDWTGFYAGIFVGAVASKANAGFDYLGSETSLPSSVDIPALGALGGVKLGYNWQTGNLVFGLEGDASVVKLTGTASGESYAIDDSLNSLLSLRARLGLAFDRMMIFATAGVGGGQASFTADGGKGDPDSITASGSGFVYGPMVGGGVEYAINDHVSITTSAEYYRFSQLSGNGDTGKGTPDDPFSVHYAPAGYIFETGLNVRF